MGSIDPRLSDALSHLPEYLAAHVLLSFSALLLGIAFSVPLALACLRSRRASSLILGTAAVIQTIPSLALLALFYPVLLFFSAVTKALTGTQFSALGFLPSLLALTLYSVLPIVRNTVTGIAGIEPAIREAAAGSGMTPLQSLVKVEFPIALPIIMAGIRTASVLVIGTATLSTPVGQTSLGNYIFTGLQTQNWVDVMVGCVAAAGLALVADRLLGGLESMATRRGSRTRLVAAATAILVVLGAGGLAATLRPAPGYLIGAKGFPEQYVLASLIEQRLAASGLASSVKGDLGSAVIFRALTAGDLDVYVDYSGTIWTNFMHRTDAPPREAMLKAIGDWVRQTYGATMLGPLGFQNAYVLAMRKDRAQTLGIKSVSDLARISPQIRVGGDYEIFGRPEWQSLRRVYGVNFHEERQMQPIFMYKAVADGDVDAITAFSSDGRIAQYGLVTLDDPEHAIPPYDAVLLLSPKRRNDRALIKALQPLIGRIAIEKMREANLAVSRDENQLSAGEAARLLWRQISGDAPSG